MSETRLTPARRAELGALCGPGIKGRGLTRIHARSRALPEALAEVDRLTALALDERRRAERLLDDLLVEKGFVAVLRDDIARLKAKVARLEAKP